MRFIGPFILVAIVGLVSLIGGWWLVAEQQARLSTWRQVTAIVTHVEPAADASSPPVIGYEFRAAGRTYKSANLTPMGLGSPDAAQRDALAALRENQFIEIRYDPADPSRSYVIEVVWFTPYLLALLPAVICMGAWWQLSQGGFFSGAPVAYTSGQHDWYTLVPASSTSGRMMLYAMGVVAWYAYGLLVFHHYLTAADAPVSAAAPYALAGYVVLGLPLVARGLIDIMRSGSFDEPTVRALSPQFDVDGPIVIHARHQSRGVQRVRLASAALVCVRRLGVMSEELYRETLALSHGRTLKAGERIERECTFRVPPMKRRASSRYTRWEYPRDDWMIELRVQLESGMVRIDRFPLYVLPPKAIEGTITQGASARPTGPSDDARGESTATSAPAAVLTGAGLREAAA